MVAAVIFSCVANSSFRRFRVASAAWNWLSAFSRRVLRRVLLLDQRLFPREGEAGVGEVRLRLADLLGVGQFDLGERVLRDLEGGLLLVDVLHRLPVVDQGDELSGLHAVADFDVHFIDLSRRPGADLHDRPDLGFDDAGLDEDAPDVPPLNPPRFQDADLRFREKLLVGDTFRPRQGRR